MIIVVLHDPATGQVMLKAEGAANKEQVKEMLNTAIGMLDNQQQQAAAPQPTPPRPPQILVPRPGAPRDIRSILPQNGPAR
jgi:hypothetical protein